jgi:predicted acylesterase/phospholipase RssA
VLRSGGIGPAGWVLHEKERVAVSSTPPPPTGANPSARRTLQEHLDPRSAPKRILALDGGGVRGILSLQYLKHIEGILRERRRDHGFVLADYFDLIGGTSTGAIIAGGLALGFAVDDLIGRYRNLAARIFRKPWYRIGAIVPKFGAGALREMLQETYGAEVTLGSPKLMTGLMIMAKRMDTGSPWPLTNHPRDPYYQPVVGKKRIGNANMLLWQVVRASTAAPHYFKPEDLEVGHMLDPATGHTLVDRGQFVDGGVSTANNPSLQLLKVAWLKGFAFGWPAGEDRLLLVSVGTGRRDRRRGRARGLAATAGAFALRALVSIMDDCGDEVETVIQWLSSSPTARRIDGQIGDLTGDLLAGRPLLSYRRYDLTFGREWFKDQLGLEEDQASLDDLAPMDRPANMDALAALGEEAARLQVRAEHLPPAFDPA